jgi:hypothetical protein
MPSGDEKAGGSNADRGTNIHNALRVRNASGLNGDESRVYSLLLEGRDLIVSQWDPLDESTHIVDDLRLFLRYEAMRRIFSGQPDESIIIGLTFMFTLIYVAARLLLEILYVFLDPRVRYR